jgi:hypothetical protein
MPAAKDRASAKLVFIFQLPAISARTAIVKSPSYGVFLAGFISRN